MSEFKYIKLDERMKDAYMELAYQLKRIADSLERKENARSDWDR